MDEDAGFWPAYVAAIAGLIQGMLLVLAVMTIALVQVVTVSGEQTKAMAEAAEGLVESAEADNELAVVFSGWAWRVDESTRQGLQKAIQDLKGQGARHWRLVMSTDLNSSLARRAAYLRMTMIRNVLLGEGVLGTQIDMALMDTPDMAGDDGRQTVTIQTQTQTPRGGAIR